MNFSERRRHPRRSCAVSVELRHSRSSYPLRCETSDISLGGCYVKNVCTLPAGTVVDLVVWTGDEKVIAKGVIQTVDAGVGNGIKFTVITDEHRKRLQEYLATQEDADPGSMTIIR